MNSINEFYLTHDNINFVEATLNKVINKAMQFKSRNKIHNGIKHTELIKKYLSPLPIEQGSANDLLNIIDELFEDSFNFSSSQFLGFPDAGNSIAGLMGGVLEATSQQNLLNSDFCARAATFIEINTINWLRELVGYPISRNFDGVDKLGGIATTGGTCSNMYGLLMARKKAFPNFFKKGMPNGAKPKVFIASDITHYSVSGAAGLIGLGTDSIIKVPTNCFRFDLTALKKSLEESIARGELPICVVINIGDSRTLTIDDIKAVCDIVKEVCPKCWIHADACHGGQLLFSKKYRNRIAGIEQVDSITIDPHKVLNIPYTLSYFLFKDPKDIEGFWVSSSLIMRDKWSLGQLTPNIGSKSWSSIKLFLLIKHLGYKNIANVIDERISLCLKFRERLQFTGMFEFLTNNSDINSVPFIYTGNNKDFNPEHVSKLNEKIYNQLLTEGEVYFHGFQIRDDENNFGHGKDKSYFVLRYMAGNPAINEMDLDNAIQTLIRASENICNS